MTDPAQPRKPPVYSQPVFKQTLEVKSLPAQKILAHIFERVSNGLIALNITLFIRGKAEAMDAIEDLMSNAFAKMEQSLEQEMARLKRLMEDNGIQTLPVYTRPIQHEVEISSPQAAQFFGLIKKLDSCMALVDTLWINRALSSRQRLMAIDQWQDQFMKLARYLGRVGRRARETAQQQETTNQSDDMHDEMDRSQTESTPVPAPRQQTAHQEETP